MSGLEGGVSSVAVQTYLVVSIPPRARTGLLITALGLRAGKRRQWRKV